MRQKNDKRLNLSLSIPFGLFHTFHRSLQINGEKKREIQPATTTTAANKTSERTNHRKCHKILQNCDFSHNFGYK